jgi:hypothetical protein
LKFRVCRHQTRKSFGHSISSYLVYFKKIVIFL